jgi:hypothetical protein
MSFEGFAIVELMGHVRVAGWVTEEELFGTKLGRVDIPDVTADLTGGARPTEVHATQYFNGSALYRLTPCDEATARELAAYSQPRPTALRLGSAASPDADSDGEDSESLDGAEVHW